MSHALFMRVLAAKVRDLGGGDEHLASIVYDQAFCAEIARTIVGHKCKAIAPKCIEDLIALVGFFHVNFHINDRNFPITGPIADVADMLTVTPQDLGQAGGTYGEFDAEIDRRGYRHATLAEGLVWAKAKWDRCTLVVVAGSSWDPGDGIANGPYMGWNFHGPVLQLGIANRPHHSLLPDSNFLVVRKQA